MTVLVEMTLFVTVRSGPLFNFKYSGTVFREEFLQKYLRIVDKEEIRKKSVFNVWWNSGNGGERTDMNFDEWLAGAGIELKEGDLTTAYNR